MVKTPANFGFDALLTAKYKRKTGKAPVHFEAPPAFLYFLS
jgi:hypothetical protein